MIELIGAAIGGGVVGLLAVFFYHYFRDAYKGVGE